MASITEYLNKIINATFGREVRRAIYDAIRQLYDDASKNGNANMEVSMARGTEPTLNDRLNRDYDYLNMLILSLSAGGPKELFYSMNALNAALPNGADYTVLVFDTSYMDGAHSFIWTGDEWKDIGAYQGVEVPDNTITNKKLDLVGVELPTTFNVGMDTEFGAGSPIRAYTYKPYPFKKGDTIESGDGYKVQVALFNPDKTSYTTEWQDKYTLPEDKELYLGLRKPDDSVILAEELPYLNNFVFLTNEHTVTNYERNVEIIKSVTRIYDGVIRNDNLELIGAELPKTLPFNKTSTSNRLYTGVLSFKKGEVLNIVEGSETHFALFTPENVTFLGWNSGPYTITSDRDFYVALRKADDSLFTNEEIQVYRRNFYVTDNQTLVSYKETKAMLAGDGVKIPSTLLFERTGADNRVYSDTRMFSKGSSFIINTDAKLEYAAFTADNKVVFGWGTAIYTLAEDSELYIAIRKVDDSAIPLTEIPFIQKQFYVKDNDTVVTFKDAARLIDKSGLDKILYVSPDGSDENDGTTKATALATFQKAIDLGATIIQAKRGVYYNQSAAKYNSPIKIIPYEQDAYSTDHVDRQKIEINNGSFFAGAATGELYTFEFAGNNRFRQVFIDKTLAIDTGGSRPSYNVGMWQTHLDWTIDAKLKPVLTLEEVQAESGTFTWDGTTVTVNPADTTIDPLGFTVHSDINNGFTFQHCPEVVLEDVVVKYSLSRNIRLLNCMNVTARNSGSMYTMFADGWQLDYTNGNFYNCIGHKSRNDGFNLHYFGDTHFFDCQGHYNDDDGISHHDGCTGSINNSHFTFNGKSGIAPTYGSIVNLFGNLCTDNYFNYYCISDAANPRRTVRHQGNISLRPGRSDITIRGYDILGYQNLYANKELTADSSYTDLGA